MLCATILCGQNVLVIEVSDKETGKAVQGIEVFQSATGRIYSSNEAGLVEIKDVSQQEQGFVIFGLSHNTIDTSFLIVSDTMISIEVSKLNVQLSTVEIGARRKELFALKRLQDVQGTAIYAGRKTEVVLMDLINGNLANNVSRQIYAQVSGLNIYEGSSGGLQLGIGGRGLDPNRTSNFNTRQDGYDISADVLGYPENYYTPPANLIDEIELIRGASSLQYGTQFGGLLNFKLYRIPSFKKSEIEFSQTLGSYGFMNTYLKAGYNFDKFSVSSFINYKRGDGYRLNSDFNALNAYLNVTYTLSDHTILGIDLTYYKYLAQQAGGLTDTMFEEDPQQSNRERNWFEVDWKLWSMRLDHELGKDSKMSFIISGLYAQRNSVGFRGNPINLNDNPITALDEQDTNGNYILPRDLIKGVFRNINAEARYLSKYEIGSKKAVFLIGAKVYDSNNDAIQGPGSTSEDADFNFYNLEFPDYPSQSDFNFPNFNLAAFSENIFYLSDRWSITPGLRFEYIRTQAEGVYNNVVFDNAGNPINNIRLSESRDLSRQFLLAGISSEYKLDQSLKLYSNFSQNYRSVTFSDIRVVSPTFIVAPDIMDERGFTADLGARGRFGKLISYDINAFGLWYNDRIGIILDNRANRVRKNIGNAFIGGMESLFDLNIDRMIWGDDSKRRLNLFVNTAITFSEYTKSEENNVQGKRVEFIPTVNLKTGLNIGLGNFEFSMQYSYISEQFTDVQNSERAFPGDNREGVIGPIPAYQIWDISLTHTFKQFKFSGGINNALNQSYFTRRATGYPGPGIIPSDGRAWYFTLSYSY
ncbi:MAG: TonB-dependent receptor [Saprospiraceae bacterium]|nr:TonB-dependent receptor [Saprospiraceae bacterium]